MKGLEHWFPPRPKKSVGLVDFHETCPHQGGGHCEQKLLLSSETGTMKSRNNNSAQDDSLGSNTSL